MVGTKLRGETKRSFVQRLFTRIAPRYDLFNRLVSCGLDQGWRREAIARGQVHAGDRVLDVCAGTGDLTFACLNGRAAERLIVGIDMNRAMLVRAHEKQRHTQARMTWLQGDAEALPFATGSFDRVLIGFSTRNLSDLGAGLQEMVRVLRPGGTLIILETGRPAHPALRMGYFLFLFTAAPLIGFLLTGRLWPFTYLARSVKRFLTPRDMVARLQQLQTEVDYVPLSQGLASLFLAVKR